MKYIIIFYIEIFYFGEIKKLKCHIKMNKKNIQNLVKKIV